MPLGNVYEEFVIFCKGRESVTRSGIGDTLVIAKRTPVNQQVERSLVPNSLTSAGLDPVKPKSCNLGLPFLG